MPPGQSADRYAVAALRFLCLSTSLARPLELPLELVRSIPKGGGPNGYLYRRVPLLSSTSTGHIMSEPSGWAARRTWDKRGTRRVTLGYIARRHGFTHIRRGSRIPTHIARHKDLAAPICSERTLLVVLEPIGPLERSAPSERLQQATNHRQRFTHLLGREEHFYRLQLVIST